MKNLRVSVLQFNTEDAAVERNVSRALAMIDASPDVDLIMLPELWTTGYAHAEWDRVARTVTPGVCVRLQKASTRRRAWIGGSQISLNATGRLVNRFWLFGPQGEVSHYDKGHLFAPMGEPTYLAAGDDRVMQDVNGWPAALSICFDLRFPEMYRLDAMAGAQLMLVASAWPAERAETLQLLARARAIENQTFLILCNRMGVGLDGTRFGGGSMVVAPDGRVLIDAGDAECTISMTLDASLIESTRSRGSMLELRRPGLDWVKEESPYAATTPATHQVGI